MLIFETCRFISVHPRDFISVTLSKTLPYLFATFEGKVLEDISKELGEPISRLFINPNHCHEILAHVYLLHGGQTNRVLKFITEILSDTSGNEINIQSIVKSSVVSLLANLVVVLGAEDEERTTTVWLCPTCVQSILIHDPLIRQYMLCERSRSYWQKT